MGKHGDRLAVQACTCRSCRRTLHDRLHCIAGRSRWRAAFALLLATPLLAQSQTGELRLQVTDPSGLGLLSTVTIQSTANQVQKKLATSAGGTLDAARLPFGTYQVTVEHAGFAAASLLVEIDSALPRSLPVSLSIQDTGTAVHVASLGQTLLDPAQAGSVNIVGQAAIRDRLGSLPGRSVIDLVNQQPGWLYEGNAVLHPRGSEYQTQFVIDGIPYTDNRSPGFNVEVEAEDVQSLSVYTAGFPAEYGRKMGGVVELNTIKDPGQGLHLTTESSGGSFDTASAYLLAQYGWVRSTATVSAQGAHTSWFEDPPVLQNYTNAGTTGDFSGRYEYNLSPSDRLTFSTRHEFDRFLVPNEQLQQAAGQRQDRDTLETAGSAGYQHIFSPDVLANLVLMVRDDTTHLSSNPASTPILAAQDRGYRESYLKATISANRGRQEWKAGAEADFIDIHEQFSDLITDPTQFDPRTPAGFAFQQRGDDREQGAFVQDTLHFGQWNLAAGVRWDHYRLLVDENAVSPRLSLSRSFPQLGLLAHFSYDRIFQTPAFENILLSSSAAIASLNPEILRLPVQPSHGNYYEAGVARNFAGQLRLDVNYFLREVNNYADDDQLLDTAVSFPVSFQKAHIYGSEAKLELPHWHDLSGFVSYSYIVGSAYLPVTGGLFLGDDATSALTQTSGRFWDSQDQRNTLRTRIIYQVAPRLWFASGAEYGSGLPTEFDGDEADAVAQYGQQLVSRVNLEHGRVLPSLSVDASAGAELLHAEKATLRLQIDGANLNNRINLVDFAGLFSGNAVAPPRSWNARLRWSF